MLYGRKGLIFGPKFEGEMDSKTISEVGDTIHLFGDITAARLAKLWLRWDRLFNNVYNKQMHQILNIIYRFPASAIKTKLYHEICEEVRNKAGNVTSEDVSKLKYLDGVLKETLRRFTVVPFISRENESEIKLGDYTIPSGTNININVIGMHNNPQLFPDPERFDPDRFTDENINKRHKYSFLPFSGGARDCIGKKYAWVIMKIVLVHLIREFQFTSTVDINKLEFCYNLTLITKGPNPVSIKKRNVCF